MAATSFPNCTPELMAGLVGAFGKAPAFSDQKKALFNNIEVIDQQAMKRLANEHHQAIVACLHAPGEVVKMTDGTEYIVGENGAWRKKEK